MLISSTVPTPFGFRSDLSFGTRPAAYWYSRRVPSPVKVAGSRLNRSFALLYLIKSDTLAFRWCHTSSWGRISAAFSLEVSLFEFEHNEIT